MLLLIQVHQRQTNLTRSTVNSPHGFAGENGTRLSNNSQRLAMASGSALVRPFVSPAYALPRHLATSATSSQASPIVPGSALWTQSPRNPNWQLRELGLSRICGLSAFTSSGLRIFGKDGSPARRTGLRKFGSEGAPGIYFEGRAGVSVVNMAPDIGAGEIGRQSGRPEMFSTESYVPPAWASHLHPIPSSFTSLGIVRIHISMLFCAVIIVEYVCPAKPKWW